MPQPRNKRDCTSGPVARSPPGQSCRFLNAAENYLREKNSRLRNPHGPCLSGSSTRKWHRQSFSLRFVSNPIVNARGSLNGGEKTTLRRHTVVKQPTQLILRFCVTNNNNKKRNTHQRQHTLDMELLLLNRSAHTVCSYPRAHELSSNRSFSVTLPVFCNDRTLFSAVRADHSRFTAQSVQEESVKIYCT